MAGVKIIGKVAVKVMPDTEDFKPALKRDLERIESSLKALEVDVLPKMSTASKEILKAEMNALQKNLDGKNVEFDVGLNQGTVAYVESALSVLTRGRRVSIDADFDADTFGRLLENVLMLGGARPQLDALAASFEKLGELDKVAISTGLVASKIMAVSIAAVATTGHVLSLTSSLASMAPAALALPGIFGGVAVGLGITGAAFKDLNDVIPELGDKLGDLQNKLSANFWAEAETPIRNMIDTLWPALEAGVLGTSTALGTFFGNLASSFSTVGPALTTMFDALTESVDIFSQHTGAIVGIITELGLAGSAYLPQLATWFGDILEDFENFLAKAAADGRLQGWIDTGIDALQDFGRVIQATYGIFDGLAQAASNAGGASLDSLADGLERIETTVSSPEFQKGLTDTFTAAYDAVTAFNDAAGPGLEDAILAIKDMFTTLGPGFAESLGNLVGAFGTAFADPAVAQGASDLFVGISNAMNSFANAAGPTMLIVSSLGQVLGAMLTNIAAIGTDGIDRLAPTIQNLSKAIVPIINKLGTLIGGVFSDLTPVFKILGENLTRVVTAFGPLIDTVQRLWNLIAPVLIPVLKVVVTILGDMLVGVINGAKWVLEGLIKIITGVIDVFKGLWDVVAGLFTLDFSRIASGFGGIFSGLGSIIVGAIQGALGALWAYINGSFFAIFRNSVFKLASPFGGLIAKIGGFFGKLWEVIAPAFRYIVKGSEDGVKAVGGVWSRIVEVFEFIFPRVKAVFDQVFAVVKAVFGAIKAVIEVVFKVIGTIFKVYVTIWGAVIKTFVTVFKVIFKGIKAYVETVLTGLKIVFETAWLFISNGARIYLGLVKTYFTTIFNAIKAVVTPIINGLKAVFQFLWDAILLGVQFAKTAFDDFMAGFSLLAKWVDDAIQPVVEAFSLAFAFIKSAIDDVIVFFMVRVPEWITAFKTVIDDGLNFIKGIFTGAWDFIKNAVINRFTAIKDRITSLIGNVKETMGNVWNAIKTKVTEIWDGIKSKISDTFTAAKDKVSSIAGNIKTLMSDAWTAVKDKVVTAWDGIKTTIGTKLTEVKEKVGELPGKAKDALVGIGATLINAGKDLIGGFIDGIKDKFDDVRDTLSGLTDKLTDWKGPESLDRVLLIPVGQMIIDGFVKGLESRYSNVRDSLQGLTDDVADSFSSGTKYSVGIATSLDTTGTDLSAIGSLDRTVSLAARTTDATDGGGNVQIDNLLIPLEDLAQLKNLEDFLDMLRVRSRQGALA